jgi:hypothetical protein
MRTEQYKGCRICDEGLIHEQLVYREKIPPVSFDVRNPRVIQQVPSSPSIFGIND